MAERNAIAVLIKLLGGEAMTEELKKLGETGEKAMASIEESAKKVQFGGLGNDLSILVGDIGTFATRSIIALGTLKAAADGVGAALFFLAKSGAEAAVQANNAAQAAGISAKSYQEWAFAADSVGVSQAQVSTALNIFNKQVNKTAEETTKAGKAGAQMGRDIQQGIGFTVETFKDLNVEVTRFGDNTKNAGDKAKAGAAKTKTGFDELGISVKNASGVLKTNDELLAEVANAFQKMPDGARKSAIAIKLFGIEGAKLIPLLDKGAAGIEEFKARAAELGIVFTDDQIKAALAFDDSLNELKKSVSGLLRQIGLIAVPSFTAGFNAFRDIILRNKAAILDFARSGVATASAFLKDFFATLAGRDSEVTSNRWLISWRDAIKGFGEDFAHVATGVVIPAMAKLRAAADVTIKAVNGIFGTNLTAGEVLIGATILRLVGGLTLLKDAAFLAINAISLLSRALLLTPAGRVLLAIALGVEGLIAAWDHERARQQAWIAGTDAHKNALNELKAAIEAVKAGIPGAEANLQRLAQAHLNSARAALEDAKAQVEQQQEIVDAMKQGGEFAAPLGADIDTQTEALLRANINLAKRTRELDEVQKTIDGKVVGNVEDLRTKADAGAAGLQTAAGGAKALGTEADAAATKVGNLDHQITVFRGGGAGGSLSKEVFDVVDGVARRADQSKAALDGVADSAKTAADKVKNVSSEVTNSVSAIPDAIKPDAAAAAVDGIVTDVNKIAPAAQEAADGTNTALSTIDAGSAAQAADAVAAPFESLPGKISSILSGIQSLVQNGFSALSATVNSLAGQIDAAISRILSALQAAAEAARQLRAQAASDSSGGGGSHGGFAEGGHVVGAGGPKSDSILAWLSNGEFVLQAAAVRRLGVGFLNALNQGFLPSLKGLRGFSIGGVVDNFNRSMAIPRYAGGGLASAPVAAGVAAAEGGGTMRVKLDFGLGVDAVFDLVSDTFTATRLQQFALKQAATSAGRRPR